MRKNTKKKFKMTDFFKFPSTPHLWHAENMDLRRDKVMSEGERDAFLCAEVRVEEKIDGANLGISFDEKATPVLQNRGSILSSPYVGQWKSLPTWVESRLDQLKEVLSDRYILFGEWCYAKHSIYYENLPDWFLAFDVYDKVKSSFLAADGRNRFVERMEVSTVPFIAKGKFTMNELRSFLGSSNLGAEKMEGLVLRKEDSENLQERAKMVRPEFVQAIEEHWRKKPLNVNRVAYSSYA